MFNFNNTILSLGDDFYSKEKVVPTKDPKLVMFNDALASQLNIQDKNPDVLVGNTIVDGAAMVALPYAGHQFGTFTMLGDGRAILLGEHVVNDERFDIQLKGSGRTAFSKVGDGKLPLDAALREFLISEAMHHLNIPTTRSLAIVETPSKIIREEIKPAGVLTRVASSHIRIGSFEYAVRSGEGNLKKFADYTINRHYPEIEDGPEKYFDFISAVVDRQASLVAKWQAVGFIHGVMNSDNVQIAGETIDYGPCAFLDTYHPETVFSSIDTNGRYQFGNQPSIMQWNLTRFAETFIELITVETGLDEEVVTGRLEEILAEYAHLYNAYWFELMGQKLGLSSVDEHDKELIIDMLGMMIEAEMDYTSTFTALTEGKLDELGGLDESWIEAYKSRVSNEKNAQDLMRAANPYVIPRNHIVEEALFNAWKHDDYDLYNELLAALRDPFNPNHDEYFMTRPERHVEMGHMTYCGT